MRIQLLIVLLFIISSVLTQAPPYLQLSNKFSVAWEILKDNGTIRFTARLDASAWAAIGWHCVNCTEGGMTRADFAIAIWNGTEFSVTDGYSVPDNDGYRMPRPDTQLGGTNDITIYSGYQTTKPNLSVFSFERKLITNDSLTDHPFTNGPMRFIWAHGNLSKIDPNVFSYHGSNRGVIVFNPFESVSSQFDFTSLTKQWHASLMIMGFGFFMTFGIFVARYLKAYHWWFPLHIILQVTGSVSVFVAFFLDGIYETNKWY